MLMQMLLRVSPHHNQQKNDAYTPRKQRTGRRYKLLAMADSSLVHPI